MVQRTRNNSGYKTELSNYTLGLVCECGEFGDMVKKHIYHGHDLDMDKVKKELGDVMWYLFNVCNVMGLDVTEVATMNIDKLMKRYPNGFNEEDSIKRKDKEHED